VTKGNLERQKVIKVTTQDIKESQGQKVLLNKLLCEIQDMRSELNSVEEVILSLRHRILDQVNEKAETDFIRLKSDYYTIREFLKLAGVNLISQKFIDILSKNCDEFCESLTIPRGSTDELGIGTVNTYPVKLIKQVFDTLEEGARIA
jgi:hypothetical protein